MPISVHSVQLEERPHGMAHHLLSSLWVEIDWMGVEPHVSGMISDRIRRRLDARKPMPLAAEWQVGA